MLIRATIVLLAVLNLGVAAWWLWRPAPVPPAVEQPPGVPRLVLLEEIVPAAALPAATTPARTPSRPAASAADAAGADAAAADAAGNDAAADDAAPAAAQPRAPGPAPATPDTTEGDDGEPAAPLAGEPRCEDAEGTGGTRGWRVYLPPAPDLATAEAIAARIAAAGFSDYLVLRDGANQNGIALGMFSTEAGAQRRSEALRGAGFEARCARIPASTPA